MRNVNKPLPNVAVIMSVGVVTSSGHRQIGEAAELPADEAEAYIKGGRAVLAKEWPAMSQEEKEEKAPRLVEHEAAESASESAEEVKKKPKKGA